MSVELLRAAETGDPEGAERITSRAPANWRR